VRREALLGGARLRRGDREVEERRHGRVLVHVCVAVGECADAEAGGAEGGDAGRDIREEVGAGLMSSRGRVG
jgi:hypothetical protein